MARRDLILTPDAFDPGAVHSHFLQDLGAASGGVVTFTGIMRDEGGRLAGMEIEHYPGMTEAALAKIADQAVARWDLGAVMIRHRYGRIEVGQAIMMVATASRHRSAAFEAADFLMDYLKSRAPFWKREIPRDGSAPAWVDARDSDEVALARWGQNQDPTT